MPKSHSLLSFGLRHSFVIGHSSFVISPAGACRFSPFYETVLVGKTGEILNSVNDLPERHWSGDIHYALRKSSVLQCRPHVPREVALSFRERFTEARMSRWALLLLGCVGCQSWGP